jgi:hypothetical protein
VNSNDTRTTYIFCEPDLVATSRTSTISGVAAHAMPLDDSAGFTFAMTAAAEVNE